MKKWFHTLREMRGFLLLWSTQSLSAFGSAMTSYALVIWSYTQNRSALTTALLMVCSYTPYVLLSIFAGALSDRWNKKKTMLLCDAFAAACSVCILLLLRSGELRMIHLYMLNALNGMMNTLQQPASEVATTALLPKQHFQKVGGLRYLSSSLSSLLTPVAATALLGLFGLEWVILFDLFTFAAAFLVLLFAIRIPELPDAKKAKESFLSSVKGGLHFLKMHPGILHLMLFLAAINLVASMYHAAFPAMMLSKADATAMGIVNTAVGIASLLGSLAASILKAPKNRIRVICNALLFSMSTENFCLAFGKSLPVWCAGAFCGWIAIPLMNANLDAVMRLSIPHSMQGRVFAARNAFQFFTIPLGYFLGGWAVDSVFEPLMASQPQAAWQVRLFGSGNGSGAAVFFAILGITGVLVCWMFRRDPHLRSLETK